MARAIGFTDEEIDFIKMLCDNWLEELPQARNETIEDPCIDSIKQLLDLVDGIDRFATVAKNIRHKLRKEGGEECQSMTHIQLN